MTLDVAVGDERLDEALTSLIERAPFLLALDFDGVLAPLVDDPADSRPLPASSAALERIVRNDAVVVAYVSGRDLAGLSAVSQAVEGAHLVGSHGAEWQEQLQAHRESEGLTGEQQELLAQVTAQMEAIVADHPGARVEYKPSAVVLHTRVAEPEVGAAATRLVLDGPAALPGVKVTPGKDVVEIAVTHTSKGVAVEWMREHFGVGAVCYVGDDVTDETVFAVLGGNDVGVKVGSGDTAAGYRVSSPEAVSDMLARLADLLEAR